jgi:protein-arginine kinase activator protein McsA
MFKSVICKKCNWVHFEVSRKDAEIQVKEFNVYYKTLTKKEQRNFYGNKKASVDFYEKCHSCGESYKNFRIAKKYEVPSGSTIGPIICKKD